MSGQTQPSQHIITFKLNHNQKQERRRRDYSDRHTTNLVLDQRTRLNLFNLVQKNKLPALEYLINSGKEASVYKANDIAVKIFATSAMVFKNRQLYIDGDRRFQNKSSSSSNSRQLVRLWCEKEYRNLRRLYDSGLINVPEPILQHDNIIAMRMIGKSERLVDVARFLTLSRLTKIYYSLLRALRDMYVTCQLVHGDLSEYNVLYQVSTRQLYIIDVGQAVDVVNTNAGLLLRLDIRNINAFFAHMGLDVVSNENVLRFVTGRLESANGVPGVRDSLTPLGQFVNETVVAAIRQLHAGAVTMDPAVLRGDDEFVDIRPARPACDYTEEEVYRMQDQMLTGETEPAVELAGTRPPRPRRPQHEFGAPRVLVLGGELLQCTENAEEVEEVEERDQPEGPGRTVDLNKLNRQGYTREEWREIQQHLRAAKRAGRAETKKPKAQKKKERKVAQRKRCGRR